jgi:hypothetical protein
VRNRFNWLIDVAALTVTTIVGIVAAGRFLESDVVRRFDGTPIVGDLVIGVRNAVGQVYDSTRTP